MFDDLITKFATSSDPRAGSSAALTGTQPSHCHLQILLTTLTAYAAACSSAGVTVPSSQITLTLPSNWDGPLGVGLSTVSTAVAVGITGFLGLGAILLLSNL